MTPDRIALLSALAGSAAQLGLQLYLQNNPTHRPGVQAVVNALQKIQVPTEQAVATEMQSLPIAALRGPESELYVADTNKLVIWDKQRGKAFDVPEGLAGEAIARAVRDGMKRAMVPRPPLPEPTRRAARPLTPQVIYVTNQQVIVVPSSDPAFATVMPKPPVVESPMPIVPPGKHSVRSRAVYAVERLQGTNWVSVQSLTNQAGEFRVRRVK